MKTKTPVKGPGMWTEGEDAYLKRASAAGKTVTEAAKVLNRLEKSVKVRAMILKCALKEKDLPGSLNGQV